MEPWGPIDKEGLAEKAPLLNPDAPAEILDWEIKIDDSNRPAESSMHDYIRYKIFDPEKSASITRISERDYSYEGNQLREVEVRARLTRPDGTTKEFGKESILERDLQRDGGERNWVTRLFGTTGMEVKEKYLATGGIEAGSILELQIISVVQRPDNSESLTLQREGVPIRRVRVEQVLAPVDRLSPYPVVLGAKGLDVKETADAKKKALVITALNIPGYVNEPFQDPLLSRTLTYFLSYHWHNLRLITNNSFTARHIEAKEGPWVGYSTTDWIFEQDVTETTKAIRKLADEVTVGATSDLDKAMKIHRYVRGLYAKFKKTTRPYAWNNNMPAALSEEVAEFDKHRDSNIGPFGFLALAHALYKAEGLETQLLMLPSNDYVRFSPSLNTDQFLRNRCLRVRINGVWYYSDPIWTPGLPFGFLAWQDGGTTALIVQEGKGEFAEVPEAQASDSVIGDDSSLVLDSDGSLSGTCRRTLTGQLALILRAKFNGKPVEEARKAEEKLLMDDLKADTLEMTSFTGFDDPDSPIVMDFNLHVADYAEVAKDRIIFRADAFHGTQPAPFSADVRHSLIAFPYKWTEKDKVSLKLPEGYKFEAPSAPPSQPGDILGYKITMALDPKNHALVLNRTFTSNAVDFSPEAYKPVKDWFDAMARSDGHELVLVKASELASK